MLKIGLAGCGTVGAGLVRLLRSKEALITSRASQPITITAVSARDKNRQRDCDLTGISWVDDARDFAQRADVDLVVELIGGAEGMARELAEATLQSGKHFVTANKALLAKHGAALASLAETHKVQLSFEAAVAGGIPIIKTLREAVAGNSISLVRGILNGTCNFILTLMQDKGLGFAEALKEAQAKGYAEADPSADIDGHDTANKLALLTALAFGVRPDLASVTVEGIRPITSLDLKLAEELGYRIKLLGSARIRDGGIEQQVAPCLVPIHSPLAAVDGAMNAVFLRGDAVGDMMLQGAGAGADPTASAVAADIIDIARGFRLPAFGVPSVSFAALRPSQSAAARYYMRLEVMDKPGVVADIAAILRDEAISIESFIQHGQAAEGTVPLVISTHSADAEAVRRAAGKMGKLAMVAAKPCVMRIED